VGTGMAALMCTRRLARMARDKDSSLYGAKVTLCTSRGKLATQMGPKNQTLPQPGKPFFDYGCQYFTVSSTPWFAEEVQRWGSLGFCQPLPQGQVGTISLSKGFEALPGEKWVGNGGMGPMLTNMIHQTAKEFEGTVEHVSGFPEESRKVVGLRKLSDPPCWELKTKGGASLGPFTYVIGGFAQHVLTDPFLLSGGAACSEMLDCLRRVESNQIIPMQVSFDGDPIPLPFTAAHVYNDDVLSFIGDNTKKPQQNGKFGTPASQHLTLLSTADFAEREFNCNPKGYRRTAEEKLLGSLAKMVGLDSVAKHKPRINRINHWEDGLPVKTPPASRGCLFDAAQGLGWCGDFCVSPGVEGAASSGRAMAEVLESYHGQRDFDQNGLLPADVDWVPINATQGSNIVDIGAFADVPAQSTHTDLVPSAIGGYDKATAHFGASADSKGHGKGKSKGKGDKGKGKGSKGSLWKGK